MNAFEAHLFKNYRNLCGIDEVGRGSLFGPVVAGAVIISEEILSAGLRDSKKLSSQQRLKLAEEIYSRAKDWAIGWSWDEEIDEVNILQATKLAICRAVKNLRIKPDYVLIDAIDPSFLNISGSGIIRADEKFISVAAASIIAKVFRDGLMEQFANFFPEYQLAKNRGYPTSDHRQVILKKGFSLFHRRTFRVKYGC